ncbi:MAG: hypothetical protein O3B72_06345 [Proteobacteria bacterium]|jgi:hypothetical protein|nr:hypothetical protein [Pseudomonadota bacterium]
MNEELFKRIDAKEVWTFHDCVGLASEFGTKTRAVIGYVFMRGKQYVESHDEKPESTSPPAED